MRAFLRMIVGLAVVALAFILAGGAGCGRSSDIAGEGTGATVDVGGAGGGEPEPDITDFEPCAEVNSEATLVPVAMFITVDISGSMINDDKWLNTQAAFTSFFQDPSADPLLVALRFWPDNGCDGNTCDVDACATPEVALDSLSNTAHEQALIAAFQAKAPGGTTPMSAALAGAAQWAQAYKTQNPEHLVVIILVTDGEPHDCNENTDDIAAIAAGANADGILTYAVGLQGSAEAVMTAIAVAGGTTSGIFIGSGNAEAELLAALLAIAGKAVDCSFPVPDPADPGSELDPRLVRVEYSPGGANPELVEHVADAAACGASGGWYYDDPVNPTTITLCPTTCSEAQGDAQAKLDIALGCECDTDPDCPDGFVCIDHHCLPACQSDADCPADMVCLDGRCKPAPGQPCEIDPQCPGGQTCIGKQCSYGGIIVGPYEAVQGGAFSCSTRGADDDAWLGWLLVAVVGFAGTAARRRRAA